MHQAASLNFTTEIAHRYHLPTPLRIRPYCDSEPELSITLPTIAAAHHQWRHIQTLSRAAERLNCQWLRIDIQGRDEPYRRCPLEWALFFGSDEMPRPLLNRKSERG